MISSPVPGRALVLVLLCLIGVGPAAVADDGVAFFEKSIRPVLVKHCYECHSADASAKGKLKAELLLDSKQGLLTGGESGPAIVPGEPEKSLLIRALKYESYEMPPTGRLTASVIADFERWVKLGAPDPRVNAAAPVPRRAAFQISDEDRRHWAFQPVADVSPPRVKHETWVRDDLDRFVLAKLEQANQRPSEDADRHSWLRRATFAITGLPPTPDEIAAFVSDESDAARQTVIDRLLASAEFGAHWGRRWLDGVCYADNIDKSGEYRRWVVRALNEDLPYDQFLKLQIAGDLFPAAENVPADRVLPTGASFDGVIATGMWSLAVWEQVGKDLAIAEIVDSQIDLIGRQMLGLTLACARCHDHKFDPISTQDYYSLAGILFSSHIASGKLIADDRLATDLVEAKLINARQETQNRQLDAEIAQTEKQIAAVEKKIPQAARLVAVVAKLRDLDGQLAKATSTASKSGLTEQIAKLSAEQKDLLEDQRKNGWDKEPLELKEIAALRERIAMLQKSKAAGPEVVAIREGGVPGGKRAKIGDAPIYLRGEFQHEGAIAPRRFPVILAGERQTPIGERTKQSGRRELAEWIASAENPLTARVMVNRVWQQMMGRGLVRSPDNFGRLGELPTHPELLDHLTRRFIALGWSVKQLVRDIALSATFRQTSLTTAEAARSDPENRLLARMNRRRLTYEEFRDSLLRLGSTGDIRRTVFESQDRRKTDVTAAIFDGPDSKAIVPVRAETTTAPQALFLMNNKLATDTAARLAAQLSKDSSLRDDDQRLQRLWLLMFGRPPDAKELEVARGFLEKQSWERFVQALLGTNEFVYLD